ncbi:ABATE domain-containing protein [Streptomyces canus]|uniref:ABATE domain-containing protein n=1 Tax=Streptomyces canus TaxID=58343 RepID=UPI0003A514F7|nr:ABATE domain-containing protein [Streptomyces canus]
MRRRLASAAAGHAPQRQPPRPRPGLTVRHDGHGGAADDLSDLARLTAWVPGHAEPLPGASELVVDKTTLAAMRDLRAAVRALFARAVRPGAPSPADAARLPPVPEAVAAGNRPHGRLAQAATAFLSGADRRRLRACPAPRRTVLPQARGQTVTPKSVASHEQVFQPGTE